MIGDNGGGISCKISSDPNAGIGNIIKKCFQREMGPPLPYNTPNPDPDTLIESGSIFDCPRNAMMAVNNKCQIGCAIGSEPVKICGPGTKYVLDASNTLQCEPVTTNTPARFTNVYNFKLKRDRNVENFSQNNNNKCKARY
jgi:hypothetical protein